MLQKNMKQLLLLGIMALVPFAASADQPISKKDCFQVVKISNPDRGQGEIDGLLPGGARENSYTWRLAGRGDEIFIATARNIGNALVNMYGSAFAASGAFSIETFWTLINAVSNGDIPSDASTEGANIISYNRKTGEFKVVYTAEPGVYYRMAVTFGDNVYFGSYTADPSTPQYILKLDKKGNFTKVFETMGSVSMRANCEYDGHLFFAGADDREVVEDANGLTPTKMAVLRKSNDNDNVWERVADYKDFGEVAYDPIMSSWAGAPIWEMASHKGYIYATAPSHNGFVIYKGRPAKGGEKANEYGWHWEEVAGLNNGINNPGLSDVKGGEPGTMRSLIGSVYEFNGELYAYNFDHSFGGVASAAAGFLQQIGGADIKASEYLYYMYNSLQNPQKVWKLNDKSGKFEECEEFTKLMSGTTNEYIWRMGTYEGQLYISTMDAGIFYNYLTQLTNGSFFNMTKEERLSKIAYIKEAIKLLAVSKGMELTEAIKAKLEEICNFLDQFVEVEQVDEHTIQIIIHFYQLNQAILTIIQQYIEAAKEQAQNASLCDVLNEMKQFMQDINNKIDIEGLKMYLYINKMVKKNKWGFDLYRTSDGETFQTITTSGFGDKYNYGCPSFLATKEGLYIGTCNPFYGGQLYLLTNVVCEDPSFSIPGDVNDDGCVNVADAMIVVHYLLTGNACNINKENADMNGNGAIDISDVLSIICTILCSPANAPAFQNHEDSGIGSISSHPTDNGHAISLGTGELCTALQMVVTLPNGESLKDVSLNGNPTHQVKFQRIEGSNANQYRLVVWSSDGSSLTSSDNFLQLQTSGQKSGMTISDILFTNHEYETIVLPDAGETTDISDVTTANTVNKGSYYTLSGQRINGTPTKPGFYIHGGKKVTIGH